MKRSFIPLGLSLFSLSLLITLCRGLRMSKILVGTRLDWNWVRLLSIPKLSFNNCDWRVSVVDSSAVVHHSSSTFDSRSRIVKGIPSRCTNAITRVCMLTLVITKKYVGEWHSFRNTVRVRQSSGVSYVCHKPKNQKLIVQKIGDQSPCPHIFRRPCCVGAVISRSKGKKAKFPIVIQQNWKPFWKWIELPDRGNYYILWSFRYVNSVPSIVELEGSEIDYCLWIYVVVSPFFDTTFVDSWFIKVHCFWNE